MWFFASMLSPITYLITWTHEHSCQCTLHRHIHRESSNVFEYHDFNLHSSNERVIEYAKLRQRPEWIQHRKCLRQKPFSVIFSSSGGTMRTQNLPSAQLTFRIINWRFVGLEVLSATAIRISYIYTLSHRHAHTHAPQCTKIGGRVFCAPLVLLTHAGNDMSLFLACKIFTILFTLLRTASGTRVRSQQLRKHWSFSFSLLMYIVHVRLWNDRISVPIPWCWFRGNSFEFWTSTQRDAGQFTLNENKWNKLMMVKFYLFFSLQL